MPSHTLDHLENLIVARQDAVAIVAVHRPRVPNAPGSQMLDEPRRAGLALRREADLRAVIVFGAGDKAFVAVTGH